MQNDSKLATGLAFAGICLAIAGLIFGVAARNEGEDLRGELGELQGLVDKIHQVEEDSSGIGANTQRLMRDVESLRTTTQEALDRVGSELTSYRRDLNETIQTVRRLGHKIEDIEEILSSRPATPPTEPLQVAAAEPEVEEPQVEEEAEENHTEAQANLDDEPPPADPADSAETNDFTIYRVSSGDTFSSIASRHGVSLNVILEANADVDPNRLQIGQEIRIPSP